MGTTMKNVRFNENTVHATRTYGAGEEHVVTEDVAKALGDRVEVLGDAPSDFPDYSHSVYGDNEDAKKRLPHDPADEAPQTVGEQEPPQDEPDTKDASAPVNKMVGGAPEKKAKK